MKRSLTLVCMLGVGLTAIAQAGSTSDPTPSAPLPAGSAPAASPAGPAKIAVIEFQGVVAQTNEGQRDFSELRKKYEPKQTQLKAQSDELDRLKSQLQTQSATLSDAERANKSREIDDKTKALQRAAEDAQNDFTTEMNQTYQQLAEKVYQVLQSYATQNGYTVVLDASAQQSPVLWANQATNISEAVVKAYNAKSGVPAPPASATSPSTGSTGTAPRGTGATTRTPSTATRPATSPQ